MTTPLTYWLTHIDLDAANRKLYLVNFSTLFAFFFLNIFQPFGLYQGEEGSAENVFVTLAVGLFIGLIVLFLTQFALRPLVKVNQKHWLFFVCWFLIEGALVALAWVMLDYRLGDKPGGDGLTMWITNFVSYVVIMALPYFLFLAGVVWVDARGHAQATEEGEGETVPDTADHMLDLRDETDSVKLSLPLANLRMIRSADNYLEVHYLEHGKPKMYLLRNSMKNMEQQLARTVIVRCHRSYMVNKHCIESVQKTNSGLSLRLGDLPEVSIPVAKSYVSEFRKMAD